jgi:pimeloyl-ACP methyl ester carboxylesterase
MRRVLLPVLILAAAAAPSPVRAQEPRAERSSEEFQRRWKKTAPEEKASAFRHLDVSTPESLPSLYDGFRFPHWLVRGSAAEAASKIPEGPLRSQARLDLLVHEEALVRGGLAYALALAPLAGDGEALAGGLEDRSAAVRRDCARGLRRLPSRGAIRALVKALGKESDGRVRVWILDTLRAITRGDEGIEPQAWDAWWRIHEKDPEMQPPPEVPPEKREFAGVRLEVVTVPARRPPPGRHRPALFVLAPYGWTHDLFRPWLDPLHETFDVSYIRLPSVRELTGKSGYGDDIPVYPVDRLAKAFEALRRERGAEQVVLLGEGAAAWIAETYALQYPSRTAALLLVNAWIDADSYTAALQRMAAAGSAEEKAVARSLLNIDPSARDEREDRWMARVGLHHELMDPADLLGHRLWTVARDLQGFASVPPIRLDRHTRIEAPALFFFPAGSPMSGHYEADRVRDSFPKALVAALEDTRGLLWVDRHDEFHRVVRGFVDRYSLDR